MTKLRRRRQVNFHSFTHTHKLTLSHTPRKMCADAESRPKQGTVEVEHARVTISQTHVEGVGSGFKSADQLRGGGARAGELQIF